MTLGTYFQYNVYIVSNKADYTTGIYIMATFINSQHDDNADSSIDELFDDLHMHINEVQNMSDLGDKVFCLGSAQGLLDYISERLHNEVESKQLEIV